MLKMKQLVFLMVLLMTTQVIAKTDEAIFAGGNFWRVEADFNKMNGVLVTVTGFDGGRSKSPSYDEVAAGHTDYTEAVRIIYNPDTVTYKQLVDYFWQHIDPTVANAQFCDNGPQYRTVIFYLNDQQKAIALASQREMLKRFKKIYTKIMPSTQFYAADGSQQAYSLNHPLRYKYYIYRCGHAERIAEIWKQK